MGILAQRLAQLPDDMRARVSSIRVDYGAEQLAAVVSCSEYLSAESDGGDAALTSLTRRPDIVWPMPPELDVRAEFDLITEAGLLGDRADLYVMRPTDGAPPRVVISSGA